MEFNKLISIIVPVYNNEKYLKKCLDTILKQTYLNYEIIIIDDGSTDNSSNICDEFAKKNENIKVIHKKNEGVSSARNDGIKISTGEWVTFVDSDDWIESNYLEAMINVIEDNVDLVIGRTISVKDDVEIYDGFRGKKINIFEHKDINKIIKSIFDDNKKTMIYPHISTCSAKLIRKKILLENDILYDISLKYYEDAIFNLEVIYNSRVIKLIDNKIYKYRTNESSATNKYNNKIISYYDDVYKKLHLLNQKYNLNIKMYEDIFKIKNLNTIISNFFLHEKSFHLQNKFIKKICNDKTYKDSLGRVKIKDLPKKRKLLVLLYKIRFYNLIILLYRI